MKAIYMTLSHYEQIKQISFESNTTIRHSARVLSGMRLKADVGGMSYITPPVKSRKKIVVDDYVNKDILLKKLEYLSCLLETNILEYNRIKLEIIDMGRKKKEESEKCQTFGFSLTQTEVDNLTNFGNGNRSKGLKRMMSIFEREYAKGNISLEVCDNEEDS